MRVGLFIPCYIDQLFPMAAVATLELLEKMGCEVSYPSGQTCCGQPMANAGYASKTKDTARHFQVTFESFDYIVSPSGSCVLHVKEHMPIAEDLPDPRARTYELSEFIHDKLDVEMIQGNYPYRVGIHSSCHGLRGLRLASSSELMVPSYSYLTNILKRLKGITLIEGSRKDECCGFGGTFAVHEDAVSVRMGEGRLTEHEAQGAEIITATDVSCLMHLEGISQRQRKDLSFKHFAEILNEAML